MSGTEGRATSRPLMDRVVGKVKEAAGSLTGNDRLQREGALHQEHARAVQEAEDQRHLAEQKEEEAEIVSRQAALRAEEERIDEEQARAAERDRIEQLKREEQAQAEVERSVRAASIRAQTAGAYCQANATEADAFRQRAQSEAKAQRLEQTAQEIQSTNGEPA